MHTIRLQCCSWFLARSQRFSLWPLSQCLTWMFNNNLCKTVLRQGGVLQHKLVYIWQRDRDRAVWLHKTVAWEYKKKQYLLIYKLSKMPFHTEVVPCLFLIYASYSYRNMVNILKYSIKAHALTLFLWHYILV